MSKIKTREQLIESVRKLTNQALLFQKKADEFTHKAQEYQEKVQGLVYDFGKQTAKYPVGTMFKLKNNVGLEVLDVIPMFIRSTSQLEYSYRLGYRTKNKDTFIFIKDESIVDGLVEKGVYTPTDKQTCFSPEVEDKIISARMLDNEDFFIIEVPGGWFLKIETSCSPGETLTNSPERFKLWRTDYSGSSFSLAYKAPGKKKFRETTTAQIHLAFKTAEEIVEHLL